MTVRRVVPAAIAMLASLFAGALAAQERERANLRASAAGWYAGGSIGYGGFDADYERTKATLLSTGATSVSVRADAKEAMGKAYLGYRFSPNLSFEGGYWYFGKPGYSADLSTPAASVQRDFRAQGYGGHIVFWLPFRNEYAAFVKIGGLLSDVKAGAADPGAPYSALPAATSRKVKLHSGLGLEYRVTDRWAGRFEYEAVRRAGDDAKFGTADVIMWSLGANYRF